MSSTRFFAGKKEKASKKKHKKSHHLKSKNVNSVVNQIEKTLPSFPYCVEIVESNKTTIEVSLCGTIKVSINGNDNMIHGNYTTTNYGNNVMANGNNENDGNDAMTDNIAGASRNGNDITNTTNDTTNNISDGKVVDFNDMNIIINYRSLVNMFAKHVTCKYCKSRVLSDCFSKSTYGFETKLNFECSNSNCRHRAAVYPQQPGANTT